MQITDEITEIERIKNTYGNAGVVSERSKGALKGVTTCFEEQNYTNHSGMPNQEDSQKGWTLTLRKEEQAQQNYQLDLRDPAPASEC